MADAQRNLGGRIVEAARLAVLMHLSESNLLESLRRRKRVSGADVLLSTDGSLPEVSDEPSSSPAAREEAA